MDDAVRKAMSASQEALKKRIAAWLFSPKWTDTHTEFEEVRAIAELVERELERNEYVRNLETFLYDAIVELDYVQSVENCNSGLCATAKGKYIVDFGMAILGVDDLSAETWQQVLRREKNGALEGR
jgi:hypothetical protein